MFALSLGKALNGIASTFDQICKRAESLGPSRNCKSEFGILI